MDKEVTLDSIRSFDPTDTICYLSSFQLVPANLEKTPMIEFAVGSFILSCKKEGETKPKKETLRKFLSEAGHFFFFCPRFDKRSPLVHAFANYYHFIREGDFAQNAEALYRHFLPHNKLIRKKLGFSVSEAILFSSAILKNITFKMHKSKSKRNILTYRLTKSEYYDPSFFVEPPKDVTKTWAKAIKFPASDFDDIIKARNRKSFKNYINALTLHLDEKKETGASPLKDSLLENPVWERPIIQISPSYLIPFPPYVFRCLPRLFHDELINDESYRGKYISTKGKISESWLSDIIERVFQRKAIHQGVRYGKSYGFPDVDIIVEHKDFLLFFECTSHLVSKLAKKGRIEFILNDLDKTVRKCYLQAKRAKLAYRKGELQIPLKGKPTRLITIIVTDTQYPNLFLDLARGSYLKSVIDSDDYPYIISIRDLDEITRFGNADLLVRFIIERINLSLEPRIFCSDEVDYFKLFLKPEYEEIKGSVLSKKIYFSYVGHSPPLTSVDGQNWIATLKRMIELDQFIMLKVEAPTIRDKVNFALGILHEIYGERQATLHHAVFDLPHYEQIVKSYKASGEKCRALCWEDMNHYFAIFRGSKEKAFLRKLSDGRINDDLNLFVTFDSDLWNEIQRKAPRKHSLRT